VNSSDRRAREAERMLTDGSLASDGAARLLRERVRRGELTPDHVSLLAYCGHWPARLIEPDGRSLDFESWLAGLVRWGCYVSVYAAVSIADQLVDGPLSGCPDIAMPPHPAAPRRVISAAWQWLSAPSQDHAREVQARSDQAGAHLARIADHEHWWRHIASLIDWLGNPPIVGATPDNLPGERLRLVARAAIGAVNGDPLVVRGAVTRRLIQWVVTGAPLTGPPVRSNPDRPREPSRPAW